ATGIEASRDAKRRFLLRLGVEIGLQRGIRETLNQSIAVRRRRYAENNVVVGELRGKVRLREVAPLRIRAPSDREEIVHAAIWCSVRIEHESRLPDRTIRRNEGWYHVGGPHRGRNRNLRIVGRGARPTSRGERVTATAGIKIEARP